MDDTHYTPIMYRLLLLVVAIGIGVATIALMVAVASYITGASLNLSEEFGILAFQALWTSLPFSLLAMVGVRHLGTWLLGIALTGLFWGYAIYDSIWSSSEGANIGLGLLSLAWPILVTIICFISARYAEKRQDAQEVRRHTG